MTRIAKQTYNRGKEIGRLFPQGREAKEVWFRGECIFQLIGEPKTTLQSISGNYDSLISLNGKIVAFNSTGYGYISFLENGRKKTDERIGNALNMRMCPLHRDNILLAIVRDEHKFVFIKEDSKVEYAMSDDMHQVVSMADTNPFICNGILYLGTFFDRTDSAHLHAYVALLVLDENNLPVNEMVYEQYGIAPTVDIEDGREYTIADKIITDIKYDEVEDKVVLHYPESIINNYTHMKEVSAEGFNGVTWSDAGNIKEYTDYNPLSRQGMAKSECIRAMGSYSVGGVKTDTSSTYKYGYLISNFIAHETMEAINPSGAHNYEIQTLGNIVAYHEGTYYTISADSGADTSNNPPLSINHGVWSTEDAISGYEYLCQSDCDIDTSKVMFGVSGNDGVYAIMESGGLYTYMYYISF